MCPQNCCPQNCCVPKIVRNCVPEIAEIGVPEIDAITWFSETNGSGLSSVTPEVDRYCAWPRQACGYKMGHTEILAQRERARQVLGAAYDLRDFDDAVVTGGNVPLDVLGDTVSRYIAAKSAR